MASIGAIVKQITETLSDSVSQLVLFVIVLQEQNAEVPPQLPQASGVVGTAAGNLVKVACSVAEQGYGDYPDIKMDILTAAKSVDDAKDQLIVAVNSLSKSSDRKAGWTGLVDACKIIAGKTVLLLQIVYGAEVTRLLRAADTAVYAFDDIESDGATSNPADFAKQVSNAASKAHQVGDFVLKKASETDSPLSKQQMEETGKALQEKAQELIPTVNALLANPSDHALKDKVDTGFAEMKDLLKQATEPIKMESTFVPQTAVVSEEIPPEPLRAVQVLQDAPYDLIDSAKKGSDVQIKEVKKANDNILQQAKQDAQKTQSPDRRKELFDAISELENLIPQQELAYKELSKNPNDKKAQEKLENISKRIGELAALLNSGEAAAIAAAEKKDLAALLDAAKKGNGKSVDELSKRIYDQNKKLSEEALSQARKEEEPMRKMQIMNAVEELEQLVPIQLSLAQKVASDPSNKSSLAELEQGNRDLQSALSAFGGPGAELSATARREGDALDTLLNTALRGDNNLADATKEVQKLQSQVVQQAKAEASKTDDLKRKDELNNAVKLLEDLLVQEINAAKEVSTKPTDEKSKDKLKLLTDQMEDILSKLDPMSPQGIAQKEEDQLNKVMEAAKKKDTKALEDASRELTKLNDQLAKVATAQAKVNGDVPHEKRVNDVLSELETLIPEQIAIAREVAQNPSDKQAQQTLTQLDQSIKDLLSEVAGTKNAVHEAKEAAKDLNEAALYGNPSQVQEAVQKLYQASSAVGHSGRGEAKDNKDSVAKQNILQALAELDKLIPQQAQLAQEAVNNPNNQQAKEKLAEIQEQIADDLSKIASPDDSLENAVKRESTSVEDIIDAAKQGDTNKVERLAKKLPKDNAALLAAVKSESNKTDNPSRKKALIEASADLEKILPQYIEAAKVVGKAPTDKGAVSKLNTLAEDMEKDLQVLGQAESSLIAKEEARQLNSFLDSVKKGDGKAADNLSKQLPNLNTKLINETRAKISKEDDPTRRKEVLSAVDDLELLLPQELALAKEVLQNPKNSQAAQKLDKIHNDVGKALENIVGENAKVQSLAREQEQQMVQLKEAAKLGDKESVKDLGKQISKTAEKLAKTSKVAASNTSDPSRRKELMQAASDLESLMPKEIMAAQAVVERPSDQQFKNNLDAVMQQLIDTIADITSPEAAVFNAAKRLDEQLEALSSAAQRGDTKKTDTVSQSLSTTAAKLVTQARAAASKTSDPARKKQLIDAAETIDRLLPKDLELAKQVARAPNNEESKEKFNDVQDKVKDAVYNIINPPSALTDTTREEKEAIDKLIEAAKKGDKKVTEDNTKYLEKLHNQLNKQARAQARDSDSPSRRKDILEAVETLDKLVPALNGAAKSVAQKPTEKKEVEKLNDIVEQIDQAIPMLNESEVVAVAKDVDELVEKLSKASKSADPKAVSDAAHELLKTNEKLIDLTKAEAAKTDNPTRKQQLIAAANAMEQLVPQQISAARDVLKTPRDQQNLNNLKNTQEKEKDKINDIIFAANPSRERELVSVCRDLEEAMKALAVAKDATAANDALKEAGKSSNIVLELAVSEARRADDPKTKKQIEDAVSNIDKALQQLNNNSKKGNLSDPATSKAIQDDVAVVPKALRDILQATKAEPVAQSQQLVRDEEKLQAAAQQHDPRSLLEVGKQLAYDVPQLLTQAKAEASKMEEPKRKQLMSAVADLETQNRAALVSAAEVAKEPYNMIAQKNLADAATKAKDIAEEIGADLRSSSNPSKISLEKKKKFDQAKEERMKRPVSAVSSAPAAVPLDNTVKSLEELLAQLHSTNQEVKKNPNDQAARKKLQELMNKVKEAAEKSRTDLEATPEQLISALALKQQDDATNLMNATVKGDAKTVGDSAKAFVASSKQLSDQLRANSSKADSPAKKQSWMAAADEIDRHVPLVITASKELLQKPTDVETKNKVFKFNDRLREVRRELAAPQQEDDLAAIIRKARTNLKPTTEAANKGDKAALAKSINELQQSQEKMTAKIINQALTSQDPKEAKKLNDVASTLDDLLKQLMDEANKVMANPKDAAAQQKLRQAADKLEQAIAQANEGANAEIVEDVHKLIADLSKMFSAYRNSDAKSVADYAKEFVQRATKVTEAAKSQAAKVDDPARKKMLLEATAELEKLLPQQLTDIKESMKDPNDQNKQDRVKATTVAEEAVLATVVASINPTIDNNTKAAALKGEADLLRLATASKSGDGKAIEASVNDLKRDYSALEQVIRAKLASLTSPPKKQQLNQISTTLENAVKKATEDSKKLSSNPNDKATQQKVNEDAKEARDALQNLISSIEFSPVVDSLKQKEQIDTLVASLDFKQTENMLQLWEAGQNLSNLLSSFLGQVKDAAESQRGKGLSAKAQSALDLNDILKNLESAADETKSQPSKPVTSAELDKLFSDLNDMTQKSSTSSAGKVGTSSSSSNSFSDSVAAVANNISKRVNSSTSTLSASDPLLVATNNVAAELARIAAASQTGSRQELLTSGRAVAAHLVALDKEVRTLATQIADRKLQDKFIRTSEQLRNLATQLKILSAVKAAGGDKDSDEQLISLCKSLGAGMDNLLSTVALAKLSRKL